MTAVKRIQRKKTSKKTLMYNLFDNLNATLRCQKMLEDVLFSKMYEEKSTDSSGPQTKPSRTKMALQRKLYDK